MTWWLRQRTASIVEKVTIPLRDLARLLDLADRTRFLPAHPNAVGDSCRLMMQYMQQPPAALTVPMVIAEVMQQLPLTLNDYQHQMARTYKPERKANHALGVAGELGEVDELLEARLTDSRAAMRVAGHICDTIKKEVYHSRPTDVELMKKELGDVLWYVSALATDYGLTLGDVAQANIDKLKARYPDGFVPGGGNR